MTKQLEELKKGIIEDIIMRRECNSMEPEKAKLLIKLYIGYFKKQLLFKQKMKQRGNKK